MHLARFSIKNCLSTFLMLNSSAILLLFYPDDSSNFSLIFFTGLRSFISFCFYLTLFRDNCILHQCRYTKFLKLP